MTLKLRNPLVPSLLALAILSGCQGDEAAQTSPVTPQSESAVVADAKTQAGSATVADSEVETARLTDWLDTKYEEELQFSPIQLTFLGRKDLNGKIDDLSEAAELKQLEWRAATVQELKEKFDYSKLTAAGKESYDLWVFQYEEAKAAEPFKRNSYIFHQMSGPHTLLPTFLISFHKVDDEQSMRAYISRIGESARALGQSLERAQLAAKDGIRPPRFAYEATIEQSRKVIAGQPFGTGEDSPLWADAKQKIAALQEGGKINAETAADLQQQARDALTGKLQPAYDALISWLDQDLENTTAEAKGASSLPNGDDFYGVQLAKYTTLGLSADEVHQIGLDEVARIQKEMEAIREQVKFAGDQQAFFKFLREDEQFYYPNTDEGRQGYLDDTRAFLDEIEEKLPEYFGLLPKAKLEVKRVESFREEDGGAQHYYPGTPDGSRPGTYYVHMSDMGSYSKTDMETTAYHEGNPGHHMQISIAQELTGVPQFRTQAGFSVYAEGWALYSESLAKEMGQFKDPYKDFGRLTAEIWRAIRLVVDTGLHAKGWSEEQAVQYFLDNSAVPEGAARSEVRRYLVWPGQATSYKMGMLKIQELRGKAEQELGDQFDIRTFHDTILGGGALPLPLLEKRVNNWIASVKQA
ncbi:DUF885 domain-containing protein [Microbulbifer bruguierae]|uniref:DUF885 domain-containing protein n=1 Tax=Microbulbifer bruguierae TaxID=3029061 RepID=A0ABY8N9H9_9GAMM|nr:DUF885 domain-containing protein [Microbulbifer bruguierae]WGL15533.1 DUF885 domain-containing protein [Microbulbifer bruguierae]